MLNTPTRTVHLLDEMPELAAGLDAESAELARRHAVAPALVLDPGSWSNQSGQIEREPGHLGLLVIDGFMTRDVHIAETVACELVGRGDVLRPLDHDGDSAPVPFAVSWKVLSPTRLAVLDRRTALVLGRFPEIVEALVSRSVKRAHALGLFLALGHMRRLEPRLEILMWHLADRWGRVTPEGVHVPLRLTHQTLARLIGAQRPSVTTALKGLADRGVLTRESDGTWMLHGDPPDLLERLRDGGALEPSARAAS